MLLELGRKVKQWCKFYNSDKGFAMVDAIVGLVILTTALLAIGTTYAQSTKGVMSVNDSTDAAYVAKQALETLKKNDRLRQADVSSNFKIPLDYAQKSNDGVEYSVTFSTPKTPELGQASTCIKPVQVTVTWVDRAAKSKKTLTMVEYCYVQPTIAVNPNPPAAVPLPRHKNHFYDDMDGARDHAWPGDPAGKGWFYTPASVTNRLWSEYFGTQYALTTDNRAVTTAWGAGSQQLEFYDMTFPTIDAGKYAYLQFEIRNDAAAGEENTDGVFRDATQWGLAAGSTVFLFDIYVNGNKVASGVEVKASDSQYLRPDGVRTSGTVNEYGIRLDKYLNTGASAVQDIKIVWTNDTGDVATAGLHGVAGTDANASIRNISLTIH